MGRRKTSPTPRGELLGAFIASAHSALPTRSSSAHSRPSSAHVPTKSSVGAGAGAGTGAGAWSVAVKSAKSSSSSQPPGGAVQVSAATGSASATASSASPTKPRLTDLSIASKNPPPAVSGSSSTATLRSTSRKSSTLQGTSNSTSQPPPPAPSAKSFPNKRQKVESAPRYSSRLRKSVVDGDSPGAEVGSITPPPAPQSPRQTRSQRKALKPVQQSQFKELSGRNREAIALLQRPGPGNDLPRDLLTPPADSTSDWGATEPPTTPDNLKVGVEAESNKPEGAIELREKQYHAVPADHRSETTPSSLGPQDTQSRAHVTNATGREAKGNGSKDGGDGNRSSDMGGTYTTGHSRNSLAAPAFPAAASTVSPPSSQPPPAAAATTTTATNSPSYGWPYPPETSSWSVPDLGTHTFINSTRGQKVKGRPLSKAIRQVQNATRARNVANTYPRKQPFKAQIMFDGYPSEDQPMREGVTLWEICQEYPNHLTGKVLEGFVQKEWSANELCACLRDDARKVLTDRPGKDKTMVFQKRLERIKKDLMAKDEFDQLMNGPEIRPDGRPTWVKRGNVRRR